MTYGTDGPTTTFTQQAETALTSAGMTTRLPRLPKRHLPRTRLCESLSAAADSAVTLLVAPVGAGKTLGVVGWLHSGAEPDALWVTASPELSVENMRRLTSPKGRDGRPRLLVVDDAHLLSATVLAHLDRQLSQDPRNLRLLLISRWDLPFTRLAPELRGDLTLLRGDLLRLTDVEVAALVAAHARIDSPEVCAAISERAGGWCAAVVLAARAVAGERDPVAAARRLMSGSSVADRVASEVFAALSARQRHLLLCLVGEEIVSPETARHLSHDDDAGRLLEDLEVTGLLVTRYLDAHRDLDDVIASERSDTARYRLHPLLLEVARRRMASGGVDVERARGTVRRAVELDVGCGRLHAALGRLVAIGAAEAATRLLVDHGVTLVLAGEAEALTSFVRNYAENVEAEPLCALPMALHRWVAGDLVGARHWLQRIVLEARHGQPNGDRSVVWHLEVAVARLMRARFGDESMSDAVVHADAVVERSPSDTASTGPLLPLVKLHLGQALLQLGRLVEADQELTEAKNLGRSAGLFALTAEATSELALSHYLQGREFASLELAHEGLQEGRDHPYAHLKLGGALLAEKLSRLQSVVDANNLASIEPVDMPERLDGLDDTLPMTAALSCLLAARASLLRGHVADAQRALGTSADDSSLPSAVRVMVLIERALQAALAADTEQLGQLAQYLEELDAGGEAAYVTAVRAEVLGDTRAALELFATAARGSTCQQPPVAAMALTGRAQLLHNEGRTGEALRELRAAIIATDVRRNALPFLGWSRHGTAITVLLHLLLETTSSEWGEELVTTLGRRPSVVSTAGAVTATPHERAGVADDVVRPVLSPRERDVLHELARGATYADISANLFVSENTVKTHVSSLYAKLAVSRRSDALAVARTLALL